MRAAGSPADRPIDLKTDYRTNPLGIDRLPPSFSWRVDAAGRKGAASYRIQASITPDALTAGNTVWDTGRVVSDAAWQIPLAGGGGILMGRRPH